jgi:hypothetical protein
VSWWRLRQVVHAGAAQHLSSTSNAVKAHQLGACTRAARLRGQRHDTPDQQRARRCAAGTERRAGRTKNTARPLVGRRPRQTPEDRDTTDSDTNGSALFAWLLQQFAHNTCMPARPAA